MKALQTENERLKKENKSINENLTTTVASLQTQMAVALTTALEKKKSLESKLEEAQNTIDEL